MAITIISTPSAFMAAYNQVPYTVSSNMTAQPNFNFIVDINETSGTNNPLARLKYPVQPSSSQLTFDIGNVLKNYVSYDFNNISGIFAPNTKSRLKYFVQFRELYDVSSIPTLSGVLASHPTTPSSTSFNLGTNSIFDFEDYSNSAMVGKSVSNIGFLSNGNSLIENINSNEERFLYWFDPARVVKTIRYIDSAGDATEQPITLTANEHLFCTRAGKYAQDIILADGHELTSAYRVELIIDPDNILASKTFSLNQECSQYPTVRLHWMNKLGGFDAFNFNKNTINAVEIERKQFKAPLSIGYSKQDRLKTNYNTTINDKITINSDWISEEQSKLFEELATSPVIYLERSPSNFVAVNITNTNYEIKNFLTDRRMFNVSFEIEYTYSRYRQSL
jgi:hypothetical protein